MYTRTERCAQSQKLDEMSYFGVHMYFHTFLVPFHLTSPSPPSLSLRPPTHSHTSNTTTVSITPVPAGSPPLPGHSLPTHTHLPTHLSTSTAPAAATDLPSPPPGPLPPLPPSEDTCHTPHAQHMTKAQVKPQINNSKATRISKPSTRTPDGDPTLIPPPDQRPHNAADTTMTSNNTIRTGRRGKVSTGTPAPSDTLPSTQATSPLYTGTNTNPPDNQTMPTTNETKSDNNNKKTSHTSAPLLLANISPANLLSTTEGTEEGKKGKAEDTEEGSAGGGGKEERAKEERETVREEVVYSVVNPKLRFVVAGKRKVKSVEVRASVRCVYEGVWICMYICTYI